VGFVLDRTGAKPRMRLDGSSEVVEMDVDATSQQHTDLTVHRKGTVIRLGAHGEVEYFAGGRSYATRRDADAEPLTKGPGETR
jgi:hypothetical protein